MTALLKNIASQVKENLENGKKRFQVALYGKTTTVWVSNGKATLCYNPLAGVLGARTMKSLKKASVQLRALDF